MGIFVEGLTRAGSPRYIFEDNQPEIKIIKESSIRVRFGPLAVAVLFLFFLAYSTPHRIHHFFEQQQTANACPVYSLAHGCHLQEVFVFIVSFTRAVIEAVTPAGESWVPYVATSLFSPRALLNSTSTISPSLLWKLS